MRRNTGPAVFHRQHRLALLQLQRHVDLAARRGVLDGVVEQVAQHDAQGFALAGDRRQLRARLVGQAQVNLLVSRQWQDVGHCQLDHLVQVDVLAIFRVLSRAGFFARQHQQLLHQAYRPVYALVQPRNARCAFRRVVITAAQRLGLQLQGREGGAQLVRRIGDKILLRVEGAAHPAEQQVELVDQRAHFAGQAGIGQRRKVVRRPAGHLAAGAFYGRQRQADHPPHGQHQQRSEQGKGQHGLEGECAGARRTRVQVLRDLNGLQGGLQRVDPVAIAVGLDIGKAQDRARRQGRAGRAKELGAVLAPDLHIEVKAGVFIAVDQRRAQRNAAAQRTGHLLQMVVEHGVGLLQGAAVGGRGLQQRGQQNGGQHKPQQPAA